ncbi:ATP synthase subunit I [Gimesia maris]|uniref:N-ATPase subunit AtpR n=1 Tax=Gimesia maris TaxID=122 RepID=UPI003A8DFF64
MNVALLLQLLASLVCGLVLGTLFFGGLWLTIRNLQKVSHPALLFLASALTRTILTISGFWCIGVWLDESSRWQRLTICLAGFILARMICTRIIRTDQPTFSGKSA